ncbi:MAG: hypothetical protein CMF96_09025 [Candidatus Marinimicrobia bacterium]|nr:hypothetical protein [Candidatus Neomarinimicrobiota bacterium]|tara:strand:- start:1589 stop:1777 length:189 start_codon:yes stop_codon:yes gene_type:complete
MAKKQTFGDKVGKNKKNTKNNIKFVKSTITPKGSIRFSDEIIGVPEGENVENYLKNLLVDSK